jgi:hypothetical protein
MRGWDSSANLPVKDTNADVRAGLPITEYLIMADSLPLYITYTSMMTLSL